MPRPAHPVGTSGKVRSYRTGAGWRSRTTVRDYDGKTREIQKHGRTRAEAERLLATAVRDRVFAENANEITRDAKVSVVAERWFAELQGQEKSPSTINAYRDRLDKQILPALGAVRIRELTIGLVDRHIAAVKAAHGNSVAKLTKSVLSGVCGLACRHDALDHNPCRDVAKISTTPRKAPLSLSTQEIQQLRALLSYDDVAIAKDLPDLVDFMLGTGVRIGEACAIKWADVDLVHGTVDIHGTVLRLRGEGLVIKPTPKSKAGERVLELPRWTLQMIEQRRVWPSGVVFASEQGKLRDPSNTRRDLKAAFAEAGVPDLTSHVFRKSVASLMDDAGIPARKAADQLGHAHADMTQNKYYGRKRRATDAAGVLEAALARE